MSSANKLDQIVKGAPPPGTSLPAVTSPILHDTNQAPITPQTLSDLPASLPSSPPQVYLNLLILEASLRSQYLALRDRRRQNTFFILLLSIWVCGFTYLLFFRLREDGSGVGGSVYWVVEMAEKVALMVGIVTAILIWGTGQWERGVRWPRRWLGVANRGLRGINAKIVVIKRAWWKELLGHLIFLFPYSALFPSSWPLPTDGQAHSPQMGAEADLGVSREEDLSPGGDYVKLLLLPKPFSPDFRQNWEAYRFEYWEKENERRAELRKTLQEREIALAKAQNGRLWWIWRGGNRRKPSPGERHDVGKHYHRQNLEKDRPRRPSVIRAGSHSRTISRSTTPSMVDAEDRSPLNKIHRVSAVTNAGERKRRSRPSSSPESNAIAKIAPISRPA